MNDKRLAPSNGQQPMVSFRVLRSAWVALGVAIVAWNPLLTAAQDNSAPPDAAATEFFEKSVRPLLVKHCYECHAAGEANGGLTLDSRDGVLRGGDSGPAVVPGNPEKSLLIEAVRYQNPDVQMPPQNRLAAADVAVLERWVSIGAPDPRVASAEATAPAPVGMSLEEGRNFWSFRPVVKPQVPHVTNSSWVQTPIDAFVLARLEAEGMEPAPRADKRTLIRRVTFNLTGLPPSPEEVDAFLSDHSPDAFLKVVERLLESPHYGVRWGRHWLDVARYADSNGLDENLAFGNAWRYRDYVVEAFNQDKPFDQFLIEQIAGDLLPGADQASKTATGFLVLGAKVLAEPDREKLEMDTIDEQLDTIGKAVWGMTLGCARCHDHKFDPLKQSDYYSLAAIFKSTRTFAETNTGAIKHWHEHSFASDSDREKLKNIDAAISEKKKAASSFRSTAMAKLRTEARTKAAEYLAAAAQFHASMPLSEVEAIAKPLGLHPRILHHCRLHLAYHPDDAFLQAWHQFAAEHDHEGIERHYRSLFAEAEAAWAAVKKEDPKAAALADSRLESARAALYDPSGFLAVPNKPEFAFDTETLAEYYRLAEEARLLESSAPDLPTAMGVTDGDIHARQPILIRGNHRNPGMEVARGVPQVMLAPQESLELPADQSGRLELARWIAHPSHPLTARVYVNRVWRWHFGAGLVASTENFGKLGELPTHPELLDWLSSHFVESGWSTKDLHRLILASSTYQMASSHRREAENSRVDPENRLLWKFRLQRLEAEAIRDAMLAVSDRLDPSFGGKSIPLRNRQFVFDHTSIDHTKYDSLRRAMYLPVVRNNLYTLFEQFDFPDPTMPTGSRNATVVAPQALWMLNSDLVLDSAESWAKKLHEMPGDDVDRIQRAYVKALGRTPTSDETRRALAFLEVPTNPANPVAKETERQAAWALFCHSLFASNEFIYLR